MQERKKNIVQMLLLLLPFLQSVPLSNCCSQEKLFGIVLTHTVIHDDDESSANLRFRFSHIISVLYFFSLLSSSPFFSSFIFEKNVYDDGKSIRRMKPSIHSFKRLKRCEIEKTITILNIILNGINRNY